MIRRGTIEGERPGSRGGHILRIERRGVGVSAFAVRFVQEGLDAGDRVIWLEPHPSAERLRELLEDEGIDLAEPISEGRFQFRTVEGWLARAGAFQAGPALAALRDEVLHAARLGSGALRIVQDIHGGEDIAAPEALRAYEEGINALLDRYPLKVLCLYDLGRASPREAAAAIDQHPWILEKEDLTSNPFFSQPVEDEEQEALRRMELFLRYREGRSSTRRYASVVRLMRSILVQAGGAAESTMAVEVSLRELARFNGWPLGHAYLPHPETGRMESTGIWYTTDPERYAELMRVSAELEPEEGEGLCGRVLATGKATWVSDVSRDAQLRRRPVLEQLGLETAVALPVRNGGKLIAVLEFFAPGHEDPDPDRLAVLEYITMALGRVLGLRRMEADLIRSERRFRALVESAADAIVIADQEGRVVSMNPAASRLFGYSSAEIVGRHLTVLVPERYRERYRVGFTRAVAREGERFDGRVVEMVGRDRDGREFPVEVSLASWVEERRYFSGILRETTARKEAEAELRLLGAAVANVRDAIVVTTTGRPGKPPTIVYANEAFTRMTGFSEAEVLGRGFDMLVGPETDREAFEDVLARMASGQPTNAELTAYHRDGTDFLLEWSASPIQDTEGDTSYFVSIQRDVTEERMAEQALRRVDRDPLTGLANREVLVGRLRRGIERALDRPEERYALLFMDLDGFKEVNDVHGHVFGDRVLKYVAHRLQQSVRPGDTVARFGGDEFVVLLDHVAEISDVIIVADRIQRAVREPLAIRGEEVRVGASVGVALSETVYQDPEEVIRDADAAMYEAKRKGKGRAEFFDVGIYGDVLAALDLQDDLRRSLEREELRLHYQPLVDLESGHILGFEALVRWQHPERGLLSPQQFIPLAEESGLIVPMGRWILREACRTAGRWQGNGAPAPPLLSVNLSVRELTSPGLVETVRATLEETGFQATRLLLELTESVFSETSESVREQLAALRDLGIQVCIDDFGTGYSSLGRLHRLPVDKLKIDRVFVQHMEDAPGNWEIIQTILALADNLGLDVVAEGVETETQRDRLRAMACRYGQGYLFSRPVDSERAESMLAVRKA